MLNKTTKSNLQQSKSIHKTKNNAETFESHTLGIGLNRFSSVKNCFTNTMKFFIKDKSEYSKYAQLAKVIHTPTMILSLKNFVSKLLIQI